MRDKPIERPLGGYNRHNPKHEVNLVMDRGELGFFVHLCFRCKTTCRFYYLITISCFTGPAENASESTISEVTFGAIYLLLLPSKLRDCTIKYFNTLI